MNVRTYVCFFFVHNVPLQTDALLLAVLLSFHECIIYNPFVRWFRPICMFFSSLTCVWLSHKSSCLMLQEPRDADASGGTAANSIPVFCVNVCLSRKGHHSISSHQQQLQARACLTLSFTEPAVISCRSCARAGVTSSLTVLCCTQFCSVFTCLMSSSTAPAARSCNSSYTVDRVCLTSLTSSANESAVICLTSSFTVYCLLSSVEHKALDSGIWRLAASSAENVPVLIN